MTTIFIDGKSIEQVRPFLAAVPTPPNVRLRIRRFSEAGQRPPRASLGCSQSRMGHSNTVGDWFSRVSRALAVFRLMSPLGASTPNRTSFRQPTPPPSRYSYTLEIPAYIAQYLLLSGDRARSRAACLLWPYSKASDGFVSTPRQHHPGRDVRSGLWHFRAAELRPRDRPAYPHRQWAVRDRFAFVPEWTTRFGIAGRMPSGCGPTEAS